jgi:hypothetical protein
MTTTTLPASGRHYLCVDDPNSSNKYEQVEIIAWLLKDEKTQPIPITAFGQAEIDRQLVIAQHYDGEGGAVYYVLPNGPFLPDPRNVKVALKILASGGTL